MAKQTKNQQNWAKHWKRRIDDISRMWCGSCTAYARQGEKHIAELKKLCDKVSKTM